MDNELDHTKGEMVGPYHHVGDHLKQGTLAKLAPQVDEVGMVALVV